MTPPRRLKILSITDLLRLTEARLLAYRKKALSIENCPEDSDYSASEVSKLDATFIWFKSDPCWQILYDQILRALAQVQHHRGRKSMQMGKLDSQASLPSSVIQKENP